MSYHLYQTRGFILQSFGVGEADRLLRVFTEDLGLISIRAQAVRKPSSKLRPFLKELSFVKIVVVKGKTSWRLTDVFEISSLSPDKNKMAAAMFFLVSRFVHGEEDNRTLFQVLADAYEFLAVGEVEQQDAVSFETLAALQILASLGYVGESKTLAPYLLAKFSKKTLNEFAFVRRDAVREINRALEESQL